MIAELDISELNSPDETLADFLREQGIRLILPCGGNGTCGQCRVRVYAGRQVLDVPACQTKAASLGEGVIRVEIPDSGVTVTTSPPGSAYALHLRHHEWSAATDLGSTTIETAAVTPDGEVLGTVRRQNPQRTYGADVLSRIKAASAGKIAASDMQRLAESTIQSELAELSQRYGLRSRPQTLAVAGNTTMGHLLTGDDVTPLGHAPFDAGDISLRDISKVFFDDASRAYLMPGITAFVGGDILSGMYYLGMDRSPEYSLLIDLGTNGEMAFGNQDGFIAASTAAGPAFEAANISCGCAGVPGAITAVTFTGQRPHLTQIPWDVDTKGLPPGEKLQAEMRLKARRPAGLCGSGLVSAAAGMRRAGIIDENGTYTRDEWIEKGFPLWKGRSEPDIRLTQDDIRELLMAKAAIAAGITILLDSVQQAPSVVYLAGGFGEGLSVENALEIGLLPETLRRVSIIPAGNTSLKGAELFLSEREAAAERMNKIKEKSREIRLGDAPDFEELYIRNMKM